MLESWPFFVGIGGIGLSVLGIIFMPRAFFLGRGWGLAFAYLATLVGIAIPFPVLTWMQMVHNAGVAAGRCDPSTCYYNYLGLGFIWALYGHYLAPALGIIASLEALLTPAFVHPKRPQDD